MDTPEALTLANSAVRMGLVQPHQVQEAWDDPVDWDDLSLYGFYCLEAAVEAAALHFGIETTYVHAEKADIAFRLHEERNLLDVSDLLVELNFARKAVAYGDVERDAYNRHTPQGTNNINVFPFAGQMVVSAEQGGVPIAVDPITLETKGIVDWSSSLSPGIHDPSPPWRPRRMDRWPRPPRWCTISAE